MEKELKNAIMDYLKSNMERENKGMMSSYRVNIKSTRTLWENNIKIDWNHNIILKNEKPYAKIIKRYATRKTDGCYKTLLPKIELLEG